MTATTIYQALALSGPNSVNLTTASKQGNPNIVALPGGSSAIFYTDSSVAGGQILARRIDPFGLPTGPETVVATGANTGAENAMSVAGLTNGNIVVTWIDSTVSPSAMMFRIFDSNLAPMTPPTQGLVTGIAALHPDVAALPGGGFVIVWEEDTGAVGRDIAFYRYDASGVPLPAPIGSIAIGSALNTELPSVAVLADGKIVIAGDRYTAATNTSYAYQTIINGDGTYFLAPTSFDAVGSINRSVDVAAQPGGGYAISYVDDNAGNQDITTKLFSSTGTLLTSVQTATQAGAEFAPAIASSSDGILFVANTNPDTSAVEGALLSATGTVLVSHLAMDGADARLSNVLWVDGSHLLLSDVVVAPNAGADGAERGINATLFEVRRVTNGDGANDTISFISDSLIDVINGGAGNDTLSSGGGEDVLIGGVGIDTLDGGAGNDVIVGGDDRDVLIGGAGANELIGGQGNDDYIVLSMLDSIIELPGEGTDKVKTDASVYVLAAQVENLTFTGGSFSFLGIGNAGNNNITGGTGRDELFGGAGNDTLYDGGGIVGKEDALFGGPGDDIFDVEVRGDSTIEYLGEGTDLVRTTFGIYALQANVENLFFTNAGDHGAGVGNSLNNRLTGNDGIDSLFGREGDDILSGGYGSANTLLGQEGDDTFYVQAVGDSVIEFFGQGRDLVISDIATFTLPANVEDLFFSLQADATGIGNSGNNAISSFAGTDFLSGLGGNDILFSGDGNDTLIGGSGADQFRFDLFQTGLDRVLDFQPGIDKVALSLTGVNITPAVSFVQSGAPAPINTNSTFLYNVNSGIVSYDEDGIGVVAAIQLAQLNANLTLSGADFMFY